MFLRNLLPDTTSSVEDNKGDEGLLPLNSSNSSNNSLCLWRSSRRFRELNLSHLNNSDVGREELHSNSSNKNNNLLLQLNNNSVNNMMYMVDPFMLICLINNNLIMPMTNVKRLSNL